MAGYQQSGDAVLPLWKRALLSVFIAFNIVATCLWAAPIHSPTLNRLSWRTALYLRWMGLGMGWAFFAPDPWNKNVYMTAQIAYQDGRRIAWKFPLPDDYGYFHRYFMGRYFMWSYGMLPSDQNADLWPDAARYVARLNNNLDSPPVAVTLTRHWAFIPPPGSHEAERWNQSDLLTYQVAAKDLQ